jgi:hypothetical protein
MKIGVEVRALCRPVKFFNTHPNNQLLYGPCFMHGVIVILKQERAFPKLLPHPEPGKRAQDHYSFSTKLYSWHYAFRQVAFSWTPPNPDVSIRLTDGDV